MKDAIVTNLFGEWVFFYIECIYLLCLQFLLYFEFYDIKSMYYMPLEEKAGILNTVLPYTTEVFNI